MSIRSFIYFFNIRNRHIYENEQLLLITFFKPMDKTSLKPCPIEIKPAIILKQEFNQLQ